jgi:hypothetical protein
MDPSVAVEFLEKVIGGKTFIFAEPYCPSCSTKIEPITYINN